MLHPVRTLLIVAVALVAPVAGAGAQQTVPASGPRLDRVAVGIQRPVADSAAAVAVPQARSTGRPVALMLLGGAALVLGMVIGDDVGTLFSVGGAIAFLYGLYLYLR